jgi:hypothetical protein
VGDQVYVYAPIPLLALTLAVPLLNPLQVTGVEFMVKEISKGSFTKTEAEVVQPLASVTVAV